MKAIYIRVECNDSEIRGLGARSSCLPPSTFPQTVTRMLRHGICKSLMRLRLAVLCYFRYPKSDMLVVSSMVPQPRQLSPS